MAGYSAITNRSSRLSDPNFECLETFDRYIRLECNPISTTYPNREASFRLLFDQRVDGGHRPPSITLSIVVLIGVYRSY